MSTTTENLNLFKYNLATDGAIEFSITNALNNNWDIIDNAFANIQASIPISYEVDQMVCIKKNGKSPFRSNH